MSQLKVIKEIDTEKLVIRLRNEGMEAITEVYKLYRNEFLGFSQKYFPGVSKDALLHAWHDAMIAFYEICLANKYDPQKCSLKTFLFSIGKNKLLKVLKKDSRANFISMEEADIYRDTEVLIEELDSVNEEEGKIRKALEKLGQKCRRLIQLVYYHQYKAEAVQREMDYNSPKVVYSHKSRCLKQLKEIMEE